MATGPKPQSEIERFWAKVKIGAPGECWPWLGAIQKHGYGVFRVGSLTDGTRAQVLSHRYACALVHGLPDGQQALHHCDNKPCCNPAHIYAGTHADNMRDAKERGLMVGASMPGERNPKAKITEADVLVIRASDQRNADLARRYNLSKTQIAFIRKRKSWAHVNGPC